MKNIFEFEIPKKHIDITAEFEYKKYEKNETIINDSKIIVSSPVFRSIKINVFSENSVSVDLDYLKELNINKIKQLQNIDNNEEFLIFNKLNNFNNNHFCMFIDKDLENYNKNLKMLSIINSKYSNAIAFNNDSFKIKVNKKYKDKFDDFLLDKNVKDNFIYKNYMNIFKDEEVAFSNYKDSNFDNFEFISYASKLSYDFKVKKNIHVGFLIEKYLVENENVYTKLSNKFIFNDNLTNNKTDFFNKTINDINVCYGKKYFYLIYNVYNVTLPRKENYNIFDDYIVCDYPISTDIIECIEKVRPNPPNGLILKFNNKNRSIEINWTRAFTNQNDIKAYLIFRRTDINDAYSLIHYGQFFDENNILPTINVSEKLIKKYEYNFTSYIDKEFEKNKINIYTICSVDAHGMISNYSEQIGIYCDEYSGKHEIDLISRIGAPLELPNLLINRKTKFIENDDKIETITPVVKNKNNFTLYCTPDYNNINLKNGSNLSILQEKYIFSIFKTENNSLFKDVFTIKNFKQ